MKDLWKYRDFTPMLLGEVFECFDSEDYIFEVKFDGIRALIFVSSDHIKIMSRNKIDITHLYPELQGIKNMVKRNTIFDGEIIAMKDDVPSFSKLQERMHLKSNSKINAQAVNNPVLFVCFDILYDNKNVINLPIEKRKKLLNKYNDNEYFFISKYMKSKGIKMFENIKKLNLEGMVAKRLGSSYEINTRSNSWLKIKNYQEKAFLIGGYVDIKGGYSISLILGEYREKKFYYVGKVTLGKKNHLYKDIIKEKVLKKSPFQDYDKKDINYLKPKITCKVKFMERTNNNHLRQPFID